MLKVTISRQNNKISLHYFHVMPPNIGDKMQGCMDGSGLKLIKFDFLTGGQEIKIAILVNFDFF